MKAAAKARLENAALTLAKELLGMALDDDLAPAVKLAALRDALDRAGLTPKQALDVSVELKPYEQVLQRVERGPRPGRVLDDVIEAEVVEERRGGAPACRGCGRPFPEELPPGVSAYPERCRDCRPAPAPAVVFQAPDASPSPSRTYARDPGAAVGPAEHGLLSGEDAAASAAQGQSRRRRRSSWA